tara:strand:- start:52 stop:633 length:582 start_codon:yes stop_codon:yes gene_type:complete
MSKGKLVVLSAPSGTGKTSVCKQLLERNPKWVFSISATTRDLREGEVDGKDYIQMSNDKFEHCVKFGDFLEWEWVHGNKYGTLIGPLEDSLDNDQLMLLDIDVKGGMNVMDEFPDETISIFLEPPGDDIPEQLEVLEERLSMRGNEAAKLIKNRLKRFAVEIEFKEKFKYNLVNEDILETVKEVEKIIKENTK